MSEPKNQIVSGWESQYILPGGGNCYIPIKRPHPCITILIHGVNDVGEAYPFQEKGLCQGLNERLFRNDILSGQWSLPKEKSRYTEEDVISDPDKVYFQRAPDQGTSPVIPFYWGFREESQKSDVINLDAVKKHGEHLDRYGNRIDKRYAKSGGPFANATTNIPDMFGKGFTRDFSVIGLEQINQTNGTQPLLDAPPRPYMVLAAQRLACLLRITRKQSPHEAINIIAHSQGCFITLLAHAMLAKEGNDVKADTIILNNPPYSVDEPLLEQLQAGGEQQTGHAREETLRQIISQYITKKPATEPTFASIKTMCNGVIGPGWQSDANEERDNRGKVYLYFSPDDATVGLPNIQGIGNWGVYEGMRKKLGERFYQRIFTSPHGPDRGAKAIGSKTIYGLVLAWRWHKLPTAPRIRTITGEPLAQPFFPDLGKSVLPIGPVTAAIAVTNSYNKKGEEGIFSNETAEQAHVRWLNKTIKNSYHSGILTNPMHSQKAHAYDMCIGSSQIVKDNDLDWMIFLRAVADWRTNWFGKAQDPSVNAKDPSFPPPSIDLVQMLDASIEPAERQIIKGNYDYYCFNGAHPGQLPDFTSECKVKNLHPYVVSEVISELKQRRQKIFFSTIEPESNFPYRNVLKK